MIKKSYSIEIKTDGDVWFTKSAIYSLKEAKRYFANEDVNELAENSVVTLFDNFGNVIDEKKN